MFRVFLKTTFSSFPRHPLPTVCLYFPFFPSSLLSYSPLSLYRHFPHFHFSPFPASLSSLFGYLSPSFTSPLFPFCYLFPLAPISSFTICLSFFSLPTFFLPFPPLFPSLCIPFLRQSSPFTVFQAIYSISYSLWSSIRSNFNKTSPGVAGYRKPRAAFTKLPREHTLADGRAGNTGVRRELWQALIRPAF